MHANLNIIHKEKFQISLSHWGLFLAEIVGVTRAGLKGKNQLNEDIEENITVPLYHYRPLRNIDEGTQ